MRQVRLLCLRAVSIWMVITLFLSAIGGGANQPVFAAPVEQEVQPTPSETLGESIPPETSAPVPTEVNTTSPTETSTPVPTETIIPTATQTNTPDPSETLSALLTPDSSPTATMEVPVETLPDVTLAVQNQTPKFADNIMKIQTLSGMLGSGAQVNNKITASATYTCTLTTDGGVKCWGDNADGQLGDGTKTNRITPVDVSGLNSGVVSIATGGRHTCALTAGGGVKCWGYNGSGQLGDGTTTNRWTAVDVSGLGSGVAAIAIGFYHSCALMTGGGIKCWGYNADGQLGDGTKTNRITPVDISGLSSGVAAIATGFSHTCGLMKGGEIKCWGWNGYGQLGDGTTTNRYTPVNVSGLDNGVVAITTGFGHTCGLTTSDGVKCWGYNENGQLGDGTTANRYTPVDVSGLGSGVAAFSAGFYHNCALMTGGVGKCWGDNRYGQLGDGTTTNRYTPVNVSSLDSGVAAITAGGGHTCALTTGGGIKCWGFNGSGRLGDGTTISSTTPVDVIGFSPPGITSLISPSGIINTTQPTLNWNAVPYAMGYLLNMHNGSVEVINQFYSSTDVNCGNGTGYCSLDTPSVILDGNYTWKIQARNSFGGGNWSSEWDFTVYTGSCWSVNLTANPVEGGSPSITNTSAKCSGGKFAPGDIVQITPGIAPGFGTYYNFNGWGGDFTGTGTEFTMPDRNATATAEFIVSEAPDKNKITAGGSHTCAITVGNRVKCWGNNYYNQLGDGTAIHRTMPVDVSILTSDIAVIAAGTIHTCALTTEGGVICWGVNEYGQLGTLYQHTIPVYVNDMDSGVFAFSAGFYHNCALMTGGGVKCWGRNDYGQLGDGTTNPNPPLGKSTPVDVKGLNSDIDAIAAGEKHTCILTTGGGVKCWGDNGYGELGNGNYSNSLTPINVSGLESGVAAIAAGKGNTCALTIEGGIKCWGYNGYGKLGDGTTTNRLTPVDVSGLGSGVVAIAVGDAHTCALTTKGGVKCWGSNDKGRLGDGTTTNRLTPVDVSALGSGVVAIAAGYSHTCARMMSGGIKCWGYNGAGQLGDGTTTDRLAPVDTIWTQTIFGQVTFNGSGLVGVIISDGTRVSSATGSDGYFTIPNVPPGSYSLTPSKSGYTFNPEILPVTVTNVDISGQNFDATLITYNVFGQVTYNGSGLAGVIVSDGTRASSATSSDGYFTLSNVPPGSYTLTPSKRGYTFNPTILTVTVIKADISGQNFIALTNCWSVNIVGNPAEGGSPSVINTSAKCSGGKFAPGDIVQITPGTQMNYTFSEWSGELTGTGTEFTMPDRDANAIAKYNYSGNCWSVNLIANPAEWGSPSVTNTSAKCSGGKFASGDTIQITPGANLGYLFNSWTGDVTVNGNQFSMGDANVTETANYWIAHTISGKVTYDGENLAGVTISDGKNSSLTGSDGAYILSDVSPGSHTLIPSKDGFSFTPPALEVTVTNADLSGQNLEAIPSEVPSGTLVINEGARSTTSNVVTLRLTTSGSTPSEMRISNNGTDWSDWQTFATPLSWNLVGEDGEKTVYVRYRDAIGRHSATPITNTIRLDTAAGTDYSISINSGALFSGQVDVDLTTGALPGTVAMKVSNDGGFSGINWEPYTSHKSWTIIQYGSYTIPRTVYVRFKDAGGVTSSTYQDDIILDMNAPIGSVNVLSYSASAITLRTNATDTISGVGQMRIATEPIFSAVSWRTFTTSATVTPSNTGMTYVQYKDYAGNVSSTYSAAVCYLLSKSASPTTYGTVTVSPANSSGCTAGKYKTGQVITFTATPKTYYHLQSWSSPLVNATTNKMTMPASDINIKGTFAANLRSGIYNDNNAGIEHTSAWLTQNGSSYYGRTQLYTKTKSSTITIYYTGKILKVYYTGGRTYGKVTIQIDTRAPVVLSEYAATTVYKKLWTSATLASGNHKAVITYYTGNAINTTVNFDGVVIQ